MFLGNLSNNSSPSDLEISNQVYLSIMPTSSRGLRNETSTVKHKPSFAFSGFPQCSTVIIPCGLCGGRSAPKISCSNRNIKITQIMWHNIKQIKSKKQYSWYKFIIIILMLFPKIWVNYYRKISNRLFFHFQFSCIFFPTFSLLISKSFLSWSTHLILGLPLGHFPSIFIMV